MRTILCQVVEVHGWLLSSERLSSPMCRNLQLYHLHGEILHTNDTHLHTVKFYIQMILSHLHGEVLHTNEKFTYKWAHTNEKLHSRKKSSTLMSIQITEVQMRSSTYKWDTNDTLSITSWICYTVNHNNSCAIAHACIISLWKCCYSLE